MIPKKESSNLEQIEVERSGTRYKDACRKLGVIPVSHIVKKLSQREIRICGYGLGAKGTRALAVALVVSVNLLSSHFVRFQFLKVP